MDSSGNAWPGHEFRLAQSIRTPVDLKVTAAWPDGSPSVTPIAGLAQFSLVRGDSAAIGRRAAGATPDPTHWYIQRWEDETVGSSVPGMHPMPSRQTSWGGLKARYWP